MELCGLAERRSFWTWRASVWRTSTGGLRPHLSDGHAGAGAPADDAAPARPRRGAATPAASSPATAARRSAATTSALWQARGPSRAAPHPLPAGRQRGPRRDRGLGQRSRSTCSPAPRYDGVFGIWYGKGPGVDRSGDALQARQLRRHRAARRRARAAGDDHGAQSSTHRAPERAGVRGRDDPGAEPGERAGVSRLRPATASRCRASRAAGSASSASPTRSTARPRSRSVRSASPIAIPADFGRRRAACTSAGPTRRIDWAVEQERGCTAAQARGGAGVRAREPARPRRARRAAAARLGIVTTGKAYLDVRQALERARHRRARGGALGLAHLQGRHDVAARARGRARLRRRARRTCWWSRRSAAHRGPARRSCSTTAERAPAAPRRQARRERRAAAADARASSTPAMVARAVVARLLRSAKRPRLDASGWRGSRCFEQAARRRRRSGRSARRIFCSGCPHNTSTRVPEGSRAMAGIGCHGMALCMPERQTATLDADGRRGRQLDRPGAVHRRSAHLPEHRRRHLLPLAACSRSAPRSPPASTSPTRSSSTTRSR